jgi:Trypsin-co-occurring domain 2/Coenzyme PQQ synthesis protein D (PqqD)
MGVVGMGDGTGGLPSLADTIVAVRRELSSALTAGLGQPAQFRAGPVELDFEIAVTCTGDGQAGVHLSVLPPGAQSALAGAATQRIKVTLQPLDSWTGLEYRVLPAAVGGLPERPVRAEGLEVQEVADGLMVYQAEPECVHHLNNTAAIAFELCDGKNTVADISEQLAAVFGLNDGLPDGVAERCIADLWSKSVISLSWRLWPDMSGYAARNESSRHIARKYFSCYVYGLWIRVSLPGTGILLWRGLSGGGDAQEVRSGLQDSVPRPLVPPPGHGYRKTSMPF